MRIAGYIEHPVLKITIFQLDNKLAVKLESGLFEQIYKFRLGGAVNTVEDIRRLVDKAFIAEVLEQMKSMRSVYAKALERIGPGEEGEAFEEII